MPTSCQNNDYSTDLFNLTKHDNGVTPLYTSVSKVHSGLWVMDLWNDEWDEAVGIVMSYQNSV